MSSEIGQEDAQRAREQLTRRLAELVSREKALEQHLRQADGRLDADMPDRVSYTEMDEVIEGLDDAARAEIGSIKIALERLDAGTWGVCASCGDTIAAGRLSAIPHTALCVSCAASAE